MTKTELKLDGFAYQQADEVVVYLRLPNGKLVKCTGSRKAAKRSFGRDTRKASQLGS